jgi:hypothetical protein
VTTYMLGVVVRLWRRCTKGGVNRWERGRARSIAAATAPLHGDILPADEQALADAHHEIAVEFRTGEQPVVRQVCRRRSTRRPTRWQLVAAARRRLARAEAADPLRAPLDVPLERSVAAAGLVEPPPWDFESFTREWKTGEFAAIVAAARAGAHR